MLQAKSRWQLNEADSAAAGRLCDALGISPMVAGLLAVRGIIDAEEAQRFLYPSKDHAHDPFLLDGMREAVDRIRLALERGEKIRVYGDYDADGVSSTSLMIKLLRRLQANFDYYIPHRIREGYGLNNGALELAKADGVSLLVTVDTGISAREQVAYAAQLGIDVIVTDHHEPPELLPEAVAVINPKKPGCPYPYKQLAGVGVALKLSQALTGELADELLELAAIGTVADLMPLTEENRMIVKLGLDRMRSSANAGIMALLRTAGIDKREATATHIGFALAPRINASGRLESADAAVRLLTTADADEAEHLAGELDSLNKERQLIVDDIAKAAVKQVQESGMDRGRAIVVAHEDWNVGVVGIVASKLIEKFYRPALVLSIDPETGMAKGSARSIAGFDIYRALSSCGVPFEHFGGHQAAAGLTLRRERIGELRDALDRLAEEWLTADDFIPLLQADFVCGLEDAGLDTIRQLESLAPFGTANPTPRFVFQGLSVGDYKKMGKQQQHLKLQLQQTVRETACAIEAVAFGRAASADFITPAAKVDVLGELSINEWNGVRKPQLVVHDLQVPQPQLFDWRGSVDADARWLGLAAHIGEGFPHRIELCPAVLVYDEREAELLPAGYRESGCSFWLAGADGSVARLAGEGGFDAARDILLPTLPPTVDTLRAALGRASSAERVYAVFHDAADMKFILPTRDMFKRLFASLHQTVTLRTTDAELTAMCRKTGLPKNAVPFMLEVFEQLSFVENDGGGYRLLPSPAKRDLSVSASYRAKTARQEAEQVLLYSSVQQLTEWVMAHLFANGGLRS